MTQLTCALTRIELKHVWLTPLVWWHFWRVQRSLPGTPGLVRSVMLVESPRCVFFVVPRSRALPFINGWSLMLPLLWML